MTGSVYEPEPEGGYGAQRLMPADAHARCGWRGPVSPRAGAGGCACAGLLYDSCATRLARRPHEPGCLSCSRTHQPIDSVQRRRPVASTRHASALTRHTILDTVYILYINIYSYTGVTGHSAGHGVYTGPSHPNVQCDDAHITQPSETEQAGTGTPADRSTRTPRRCPDGGPD